MRRNNRKTGKPLRRLQGKIGSLISYHSIVGGTWPTLGELHSRLQQLRRIDVILLLAKWNILIRSWERVKDDSVDRRLRELVLPNWKARFDAWESMFDDGFLFSRFTILWLMRQAFLACNDSGDAISDDKHLEVLGEALLIANDLSTFQHPKRLSTEIELAANLIPNAEYMSHEEYNRAVSRSLHMMIDLAPNFSTTKVREMGVRLCELLGYAIEEYGDLAFASAMKVVVSDTSDPVSYIIPGSRPSGFAATSISADTAKGFLGVCPSIRAI